MHEEPGRRTASGPAAGGEAVLRAAYDRAREAHGDLGLDLGRYASDVLGAVAARRRRLGLPHDRAALVATLPDRALEDLYLSLSCDHGHDAAWRRLGEVYRPRLVGLVRRRERDVDAEDVVDDLLSTLALSPGGGTARTRLGTYDGTCSLWGWLASTLVNALARRGRLRDRPAGEAIESIAPASEAPPWGPLLNAEAARSLDAALRRVWGELEPEERCALVWKHVHGWSQRRIAAALGTREDRVSRWVSRGLAKLRGTLERTLPEGAGPSGTSRWEALRHAMSIHLARSAVDVAPPPGGSPPPEAV